MRGGSIVEKSAVLDKDGKIIGSISDMKELTTAVSATAVTDDRKKIEYKFDSGSGTSTVLTVKLKYEDDSANSPSNPFLSLELADVLDSGNQDMWTEIVCQIINNAFKDHVEVTAANFATAISKEVRIYTTSLTIKYGDFAVTPVEINLTPDSAAAAITFNSADLIKYLNDPFTTASFGTGPSAPPSGTSSLIPSSSSTAATKSTSTTLNMKIDAVKNALVSFVNTDAAGTTLITHADVDCNSIVYVPVKITCDSVTDMVSLESADEKLNPFFLSK
jgi:hypothetical protein